MGPLNTPEPTDAVRVGARSQVLPLYAAGFVTAVGAHSIAASLGGYTHAEHASLLSLGVLLTVYDGSRDTTVIAETTRPSATTPSTVTVSAPNQLAQDKRVAPHSAHLVDGRQPN